MSILQCICILFAILFGYSKIQAAYWSSPPVQLSTSGTASEPQISASGANNAVAVWIDNNVINASVFSNGAWQPAQTISSSPGDTLTSPLVAMYVLGNAVSVWLNTTTHVIESAVYNGSIWSPVATAFTNASSVPALAMNNVGQAILGYSNSTQFANVAFFNGKTGWGAPQEISSNNVNGKVVVAINPFGMADAMWTTTSGSIETAFFYGAVWGSPTVISTGTHNFSPATGMDNLGNVQAIWLSGTSPFALEAATFNGASWTSPTTLYSNVNGNYQPVIAVSPSGDAAAVLLDALTNNVLAINYNGTAWGTPQTISTTPAAGSNIQPQDTIDPSGNVYAVWPMNSGSTHQILSAFFTQATWGAPETIVSAATQVDNEQIAVSPSNAVFSIWQTDTGGEQGNIFASTSSLMPLPPQGLSGSVINNKFIGQKDRIHELTWVPADDDTITNYIITRNGQLLATIPSLGPYTYADHNRNKHSPDTYTVSSMNGAGVQSSSLTIVLQ